MSAIISRAVDGQAEGRKGERGREEGRKGGQAGGRADGRISSISRCNSFRASPSVGLSSSCFSARARESYAMKTRAARDDSDGGLTRPAPRTGGDSRSANRRHCRKPNSKIPPRRFVAKLPQTSVITQILFNCISKYSKFRVYSRTARA